MRLRTLASLCGFKTGLESEIFYQFVALPLWLLADSSKFSSVCSSSSLGMRGALGAESVWIGSVSWISWLLVLTLSATVLLTRRFCSFLIKIGYYLPEMWFVLVTRCEDRLRNKRLIEKILFSYIAFICNKNKNRKTAFSKLKKIL